MADEPEATTGGGEGGARPLSGADRRRLRALAHGLKPVAELGRQGLSAAFLGELDRALEAHELVKVRLRAEREERSQLLAEVARRLACEPIGMVGHVGILYRPAAEPERRRLLRGDR
jgi:RNA-binding protein